MRISLCILPFFSSGNADLWNSTLAFNVRHPFCLLKSEHQTDDTENGCRSEFLWHLKRPCFPSLSSVRFRIWEYRGFEFPPCFGRK